MLLSVSYLSSNYSKEKTIELISKTTANYLHVDLMDGLFVTNKNFNVPEVLTLLKNHRLPLDIHLMVLDPLKYIDALATLNPTYLTFHIESTKDIIKTIELIKLNNIKVGIAINPNTDLLELMPYLPLIDLVLIMSVAPGAGGQNFIKDSIPRLNQLKKIREDNNLNFLISMDGGINDHIIKDIKDVDIATVGSYICKSSNYQAQIDKLKE